MGYWKQKFFGFNYNLKDVTIQLSNRSKGMELARYMLEHAQNLEKIYGRHSLSTPDQTAVGTSVLRVSS